MFPFCFGNSLTELLEISRQLSRMWAMEAFVMIWSSEWGFPWMILDALSNLTGFLRQEITSSPSWFRCIQTSKNYPRNRSGTFTTRDAFQNYSKRRKSSAFPSNWNTQRWRGPGNWLLQIRVEYCGYFERECKSHRSSGTLQIQISLSFQRNL